MIKIQTNKQYSWASFPFIILFFLLLVLFLSVDLGFGDDLAFKVYYDNFPQSIINIYNTWSSRILIHTISIFLVSFPTVVWRLLCPILFTISGITLSQIFKKRDSFTFNLIISLLLIFFLSIDTQSAGWIVTTTTYHWPIIFSLFPIYFLVKEYYGENISIKYKFLVIFSLIYSCNHEVIALIIFFIYLFALLIIPRIRNGVFFWFQLLIIFSSIFFAILNPGNGMRYEIDIWYYFPGFNSLTVFQKIDIGISNCIKFFFEPNFLLLVFELIVFVALSRKYKQLYIKILSLYPMIIQLLFGFLNRFNGQINNNINTIANFSTEYGYLDVDKYPSLLGPIAFLVGTNVILCLIIGLNLLFEDKVFKTFVPLLFCLGLSSRIGMGFSATIIASANRTALFMFFIILSIALIIIKNERFSPNSKEEMIIISSSFFCSLLVYISMFAYNI